MIGMVLGVLLVDNNSRSPTIRDRQPDFFCGSRQQSNKFLAAKNKEL